MPQVLHSKKRVKKLTEIVGMKTFYFPKKLSNDVDPKTGKHCIKVQINSFSQFFPVEEETPVSYEGFCLLKDIGVISPEQTYALGGEFDPFA